MSVQQQQSPPVKSYDQIYQQFTSNRLAQDNAFQVLYAKCLELENTVKELQFQLADQQTKYNTNQPAKAGGEK